MASLCVSLSHSIFHVISSRIVLVHTHITFQMVRQANWIYVTGRIPMCSRMGYLCIYTDVFIRMWLKPPSFLIMSQLKPSTKSRLKFQFQSDSNLECLEDDVSTAKFDNHIAYSVVQIESSLTTLHGISQSFLQSFLKLES